MVPYWAQWSNSGGTLGWRERWGGLRDEGGIVLSINLADKFKLAGCTPCSCTVNFTTISIL